MKTTPMRTLYRRRVKQLISELQSANPTYDQSSKMLMRVISNYSMFDADIGSQGAKAKNIYVSIRAQRLLKRVGFERWHSQVINEHQYPLKEMWDAMIEGRRQLTQKKVWNLFCKHHMITVTKQEHEILARVDRDAKAEGLKLTSKMRYRRAGIQITTHK